MAVTGNVATRRILHCTSRILITDHDATRIYENQRPRPYLLTSVCNRFQAFFLLERACRNARASGRNSATDASLAAGSVMTVATTRTDPAHPPPPQSRLARLRRPLASIHEQADVHPESGRREGKKSEQGREAGLRQPLLRRARRRADARRLRLRCAGQTAGLAGATRV